MPVPNKQEDRPQLLAICAERVKGGKFKKRLGKTSFWKIRVLLNLAPKGVGFATPADKIASGDDFGCWRALTGTPFAAI